MALLLKLGGAALTVKSTMETLRVGAMAAAVRAVRAALDTGNRVLVVHGAGSFGHHHARRYALGDGRSLATEEDARLGFALTRASVTLLQRELVGARQLGHKRATLGFAAALLEGGVPAVALSPFPAWRGGDAASARAFTAQVAAVAAAGLVPVCHGDALLDEDGQRTAILSGDVIMRELAVALRPQRAVFLSLEDGVLDRPPEEAGAAVVPLLNAAAPLPQMGETADDVTGGERLSSCAQPRRAGMAGKVAEAAAIARALGDDGDVWVVRLDSDAALQACRLRTPATGTRVVWQPA